MRVLAATERTQGWRENDFSSTVPGELVYPGIICDRDQDDADGGCGCARAWTGVASRRTTTTAEVVDIDGVLPADLWQALRDTLDRRFYRDKDVYDLVVELGQIAQHFDLGTVLGRRGEQIEIREAGE